MQGNTFSQETRESEEITPVEFTQKEKSANIIDQISGYNNTQTTVFIQQINDELDEQKQINAVLKMNDYENNIKEITEFVENHGNDISTKLSQLETTFVELKNVYEENQTLHTSNEANSSILNSENVTKVASEMRRLKTLKTEILTFLYSTGIRVQN